MNAEAIKKVLEHKLDADLVKKFEAKVKKDGETLDPEREDGLLGLLQMLSAYADQIDPDDLAALAQLAGLNTGATPPKPDDKPNDPPMPPKDASGKDNADGGQGGAGNSNGNPNDPNNGVGKRGGDPVNKEFEDFKKKHEQEATDLRKAQDELRKQNETLQATIRKQEVAALVKQKYPALGGNAQVTDLVMGLEKQGLLKEWEPRLAAWNNQLVEGGLFKQHGADGDGGDLSIEQQLTQKAHDLRKADPKMTFEKAYTVAYETSPELRDAMQKRDRARLTGQR